MSCGNPLTLDMVKKTEPSSFVRLKQKRLRVKTPTCADVRDLPPRQAAFELQCSRRVPSHRMSEHRKPDKIDASKPPTRACSQSRGKDQAAELGQARLQQRQDLRNESQGDSAGDKIWDAKGFRKRTLTATWSGLESS